MMRPRQVSLLVSITLIATSNGAAQTPFTKIAEITDTTVDAAGVLPADLDGDGTVDLIVNVETGAGVKVLAGRGDGSFEGSYRVAQELGRVGAMEALDWNGDGLVDLLLGASDGTGWTVSLGLGLPQRRDLDIQPLISQGEEVVGLAMADVDGDGDDDLIVKSETPNLRSRLTWFERTAGGLDPAPNDLLVNDFERFAVKDCDGDGVVDVLMWSRAFNGPIFLRGLGGGGFSALLDPIAGMLGQDRLDAGDLNGDGLVDFAGVAGPNLRVWYAAAPFTYGLPVSIGTSSLAAGRDVRLVDLEGDGDLDLFVTAVGFELTGAAAVLENVGGAFQTPEPAYGTPWAPSAFADLTGDGLLDVIGTGPGSVQVRVQAAPASPSRFSAEQDVTAPLASPRLFGAFDIDGDQLADAFGLEDGDIVWYPNHGDLTFGPKRALFPFTSSISLIYGAEVTGDGLADLISIEVAPGAFEIRMRRNLTGGAFAAPVRLGPPGTYARVFPVDVDGDGDQDLVTTALFPGPTPLVQLLNDGSGNFSGGGTIGTLSAWARNVVGKDLDQDGILDLAVVAGSSVEWAKGQPGGTFAPFATIHSGAVTAQLGAEDLDADGLLDLYAYLGGQIQWMRQTTPGNFDPPTPVQTGLDTSLNILLAGDFDMDGFADVVSGTRELAIDAAYIGGAGAGSFAAAAALAPLEMGLVDFAMADADGDGDQDIFHSSAAPFRLGVLVNESVPSPGTSICSPAASNSSGFAASAHALGAPDANAPSLTLRAAKLPANQFGFFVGSRTSQLPVAVPGSGGAICLSGSIGRYTGPGQVLSSGPFGSFDVTVTPPSLVDSTGITAAFPGDTWYFQAWFRDVNPQGGASSNFTDAIAIVFE